MACSAGWVPVVLLLLLGPSPSHGQSMECFGKLTECLGVLSGVGTALVSGGDIQTLCSSAIQNMTQCVADGKTMCSGQAQILKQLEDSLTSLKESACSPEMICNLKGSQCSSSILSGVAGGSPSSDKSGNPSSDDSDSSSSVNIQEMCKKYPQVLQCLKGLGPECQGMASVRNITSSMQAASAPCGMITGGGACPEAFNCFAKMGGPSSGMMEGSDAGDAGGAGGSPCSGMLEVLKCLKQTSQLSSCKLDESQYTFAKVQEKLSGMCTVMSKEPTAFTCRAVDGCIMPTEGEGGPAGGQFSSFFKMTDPLFFCHFLKNVTRCYAGKGQECGFQQTFMDAMEDKHQELKEECPVKGTGGARGIVPELSIFVAVILVIVMSAYFPA